MTADSHGIPYVEPNMYFIHREGIIHLFIVIILMHLVRHMRRAPYESFATPVSNNAADLVELNNIAH